MKLAVKELVIKAKPEQFDEINRMLEPSGYQLKDSSAVPLEPEYREYQFQLAASRPVRLELQFHLGGTDDG